MMYGKPPIDLGLIDLNPTEMMFWLYCPIKDINQNGVSIPPNLRQFIPIIHRVYDDCELRTWYSSYIYLTAKTLWVTQENAGNRRGWHSDGFMTDDLNYIWSDRNGTLFWSPEQQVSFTQDHVLSLDEMEQVAEQGPHTVSPNKHLMRLDQSVIHRVADFPTPGIRTFVKVSVSKHRYNLVGNSINHDLDLGWGMAEREVERNHPSKDDLNGDDSSWQYCNQTIRLLGFVYPCSCDWIGFRNLVSSLLNDSTLSKMLL